MQHVLFENPRVSSKRAVGLGRGDMAKGRNRWDGWTYFL